MYQHVTAESPQAAHELAKKRPECWDPCEEHDSNGFRLSNEVQDVATEEFLNIHGVRSCRTCGRDIVWTINGSNFLDGECGSCEYRRYQAHDALVRIARSAANSFAERISCLRDELMDAIGEHDDINDQIANYQHLLDEHRRVLADQE